MASPADYSNQDTGRDVFTLETGDPLFKQKTFEKPSPKKPGAVRTGPPPLREVGDLPASFYEANSESYLRARRVAEMKFNTIKLVIAFSIISGSLLTMDYLMYPETWWCHWPIGLWAFVLTFPILKSFVFRGQDLRSVIEKRLHKMALREVERFDSDL